MFYAIYDFTEILKFLDRISLQYRNDFLRHRKKIVPEQHFTPLGTFSKMSSACTWTTEREMLSWSSNIGRNWNSWKIIQPNLQVYFVYLQEDNFSFQRLIFNKSVTTLRFLLAISLKRNCLICLWVKFTRQHWLHRDFRKPVNMLRRVYNRWNGDYQQHNCYDVISTTIICYDGMLTGQNCVFLFNAREK